MSETTEPAAVVESTDDSDAQTTPPAPEPEGEAALGDAGKKALDAMKAKWKDAEARDKAKDAQLAELRAKIDGKEAEFTAAQEAQRVKDEALGAANERILKAEVKAAAKGVLADPTDAYKFLDLSSFEVGEDGDVDATALADALTNLITERPYLAAQGGKRFQGTADGGARNESPRATQLTRADLDRMTPEEIVTAKRDGRFNDLMGIRNP